MKVQSVEPYTSKAGDDRWKVIFEDSEYPLILIKQPDVEVGETIPEEKLQFIQKGTYAYFVPKQAHQGTSQGRKYGRSREEGASIETQVVWKGLVEIFIAGKLEELATSTNYLATGIRAYAERRLTQDQCLPEEKPE